MRKLFRAQRSNETVDLITDRGGSTKSAPDVTPTTAMRQSTVWACLMLRANLLSSFPIDTFRMVGKDQVEVKRPPVLDEPGGPDCRKLEWMFSSQVDLDRYGNSVGIITARDALGKAARVELCLMSEVTIRQSKDNVVTYKVGQKTYTRDEIWHEKQYTVGGLAVGLSPIAHAALSVGQHISAQEHALNWFTGGAIPAAHLKYTKDSVSPRKGAIIKARYNASMENGGIFVSGNDWEFKPISAAQSDANFLETMDASDREVCRFLGVPGDAVDVAGGGGNITYANVGQRNLQLLTMHMGPTIGRREEAFSHGLTAPGVFAKFNTDALLRMDPATRATVLAGRLASKQLAPSEARALENLPPLTAEQKAEIAELYGNPVKPPTTATAAQ